MKNALIVILLLTLAGISQAQSGDTITIAQNADLMAIDPQGNLYLVNGAYLYKYSPDGILLSNYTNSMLGGIASIDVDNPMKIMVFYHDAGTIVFLNDKLAPIGDAIDLFAKGMTSISLASYSTKNNLILYDEANTDLVIMDFYFQEKERIHYDFRYYSPFMLKDIHEKMILMQDGQQGVFFFDGFGTFEKNISLYSPFPIQMLNDNIFYIAVQEDKEPQLKSYNHLTFESQTIATLAKTVRQVLIYRDKMILLDEKIVKIIHFQ